MEILAIIPARGGSKGIPGKNTKVLAGKPLIVWTIEAALGSKYITRVIVSTDSQQIADIALENGAEIPFLRPLSISQDLSTDVEFLQHTLSFLREKDGYVPAVVLRLPPTSPLRTAEDIDNGIKVLVSNPEADAVRPIIEVSKHPYKLWKIADGGEYLEPFLDKTFTSLDEPHNLPRQLFPKVYAHTGAMDIMRRQTIEDLHSTSGRKLGYFLMEPDHSVNIDHPLDFEFADYLMKKRLGI